MRMQQVLTLKPGDVIEDSVSRQKATVLKEPDEVGVLLEWHDSGKKVVRVLRGFRKSRLVRREGE